jgi:hypothetical protein
MSVTCNCTASSLSPINVYLGETNEIFQFLSFFGGGNSRVDQADLGVVVSRKKNIYPKYIGLDEITTVGQQLYNPLTFTNTSIPGYTDTMGPTIPNNGFYEISVQITTSPNQPVSLVNFNRSISIHINGSPFPAVTSQKATTTDNLITMNLTAMLLLNAGDVVTTNLFLGSPGVQYKILGGVNSYFSMRQF